MSGKTPTAALLSMVQTRNQVKTESLLYHIEKKSLQFWYKYLILTNTPIHIQNQYGSTSWKGHSKGQILTTGHCCASTLNGNDRKIFLNKKVKRFSFLGQGQKKSHPVED